MAVNLAGPGEQEVKDFFTREGGMFPTTQGACMLFVILLPILLVLLAHHTVETE